jgi:glycosyltransferase involved in cell wall biosynthesis
VAQEKISAVVCTRDRADSLRSTLAAFERQTLPERHFELIVVDNGSSDGTAELYESFGRRNRNFRYLHEDRMGLSIARNLGLREAKAEFVAYTDDDAEPEPTWLERLVAAFDVLPEDTGIAGGEVIPVWETPRPEWLGDALLRPLSAGLKWSPKARFLRGDEWLVEVNSAYRKSALLQVGGFPEHLGRHGDTLLSGDGAVNVLIRRAGYLLYYDPNIVVRHNISANRATKNWFRRRSFWQGVSMCRVHRYLEQETKRLALGSEERATARYWEEIHVPVSATGWAELFDDRRVEDFSKQLFELEQIGYLLESQNIVVGR